METRRLSLKSLFGKIGTTNVEMPDAARKAFPNTKAPSFDLDFASCSGERLELVTGNTSGNGTVLVRPDHSHSSTATAATRQVPLH